MSRSKPMTDRELRALREPCERAVGGVAGLYVKVRESGSKTFVLRYRNRAGAQRALNLGAFPSEVSLAVARKKAGKYRDQINDGRDPAAERHDDGEALRMVDLFGDGKGEDPKAGKYTGWYLSTYVLTAGKANDGEKHAKTAHSIRTDRSYISKHLRKRKALMRKRVDAVTGADLERIKADLTPGAWRKVRNILRVCFRHAEEIGIIPTGSNPASKVKATPDKKVERYLSPAERKALDDALARADRLGSSMEKQPRGTKGGCGPHLVRVIRLLSLTGMRLGSVLDMEWQRIDWRHETVRVRTKTGEMTIPLTPQAVAFLRAEKGGVARVGRVCPTASGGRITSSNVERAWRSIREVAKLDDVRLHDLRHSWASDAVSAGVPLHVVGNVLGHADAKTTARYAHLHNRAIREGLATAGAAIEAATKGEG